MTHAPAKFPRIDQRAAAHLGLEQFVQAAATDRRARLAVYVVLMPDRMGGFMRHFAELPLVLVENAPYKGHVMHRHVVVSLVLAGLLAASRVGGQQNTLDARSLDVVNRSASSFTDGTRVGVHLSAAAGEGL